MVGRGWAEPEGAKVWCEVEGREEEEEAAAAADDVMSDTMSVTVSLQMHYYNFKIQDPDETSLRLV